jgi:ribosomal protein S18 acetylase RimI-like enzyme
MEFVFTTEQTQRRADEIVDYLRGPRLWVPRTDYPDYEVWLGKVHEQLKSEAKRAVLALHRAEVIGAVVYQRHPTLSDVLEIRNISILPDFRGRHVASFLLRNAEVEGCRDFHTSMVTVDTKARNHGVRAFLEASGYHSLGPRDLYRLDAGEDLVYAKG